MGSSSQPSEPQCPICYSTNTSANKKGFGVFKAALGAAAIGPLGLAAGGISSQKINITCLNCGHRWRLASGFLRRLELLNEESERKLAELREARRHSEYELERIRSEYYPASSDSDLLHSLMLDGSSPERKKRNTEYKRKQIQLLQQKSDFFYHQLWNTKRDQIQDFIVSSDAECRIDFNREDWEARVSLVSFTLYVSSFTLDMNKGRPTCDQSILPIADGLALLLADLKEGKRNLSKRNYQFRFDDTDFCLHIMSTPGESIPTTIRLTASELSRKVFTFAMYYTAFVIVLICVVILVVSTGIQNERDTSDESKATRIAETTSAAITSNSREDVNEIQVPAIGNRDKEKLLISKRVDNIRTGPSTNHEISRKTYSGEQLYFVRKNGAWYELDNTGGGATEWIHESVVNQATDIIGIKQRPDSYAKLESESLSAREIRFIAIESAPVRIYPDESSPQTNKLYKNDAVNIWATHDGWTRISDYYDASSEGVQGVIARWIKGEYLADSPEKRIEISNRKFKKDPRIKGIPEVGEYGLSERDVGILYAAAEYYLSTGRAKQIEVGDKSLSRAGYYYLNFGSPTNHFFRAEDIPNIEERLKKYE